MGVEEGQQLQQFRSQLHELTYQQQRAKRRALISGLISLAIGIGLLLYNIISGVVHGTTTAGHAEGYRVVYVPVPSAMIGSQISNALISANHAATVHVLPGVQSYYVMDGGSVGQMNDFMLMITTKKGNLKNVENTVVTMNPYALSQMLVFTPSDSTKSYLNWMKDAMNKKGVQDLSQSTAP